MNRIDYLNSVRKTPEYHKRRLQAIKSRANTKRRQKIRSWLLEQKNRPCVDCGKQLESHLMHFDHREPEHKLFNISQNVLSYGWVKLVTEVNKCDIRCYLCHRIRSESQGWWSYNN